MAGVVFAFAAMGSAAAALREVPSVRPVAAAASGGSRAAPDEIATGEPRAGRPPTSGPVALPFGLVRTSDVTTSPTGPTGIVGQVVRDGQPARGVTLRFLGDGRFNVTLVTDGNGGFDARLPPGDYRVQIGQPWSVDWRQENIQLARGERLVGYQIDLPAVPRGPHVVLESPVVDGELVDASDRCPESINGPYDGPGDEDGCPDVATRTRNTLIYY